MYGTFKLIEKCYKNVKVSAIPDHLLQCDYSVDFDLLIFEPQETKVLDLTFQFIADNYWTIQDVV